MQDPWMEMDCPECGMDYDVPIGTVFCPGCGSEWSAVEIASANKYNADGTLMRASQPNKRYPPKPGAYPLESTDTHPLAGCSAVKEGVSVSDADIFACRKRIS